MLRRSLLATALWVGPMAGFATAAPLTYSFTPDSQVTYHVTHPMHHVTGVAHGLTGKVTVDQGHLVLPATLKLALASFNSGNANRDNNASYILDVAHQPFVTLEVTRFKETARSQAADGEHVKGEASGRLTLHGRTLPVSVPLEAVIHGAGLTVDASLTVHLSDYQVERPSLLFKPINDEVPVTVHGVAKAG